MIFVLGQTLMYAVIGFVQHNKSQYKARIAIKQKFDLLLSEIGHSLCTHVRHDMGLGGCIPYFYSHL